MYLVEMRSEADDGPIAKQNDGNSFILGARGILHSWSSQKNAFHVTVSKQGMFNILNQKNHLHSAFSSETFSNSGIEFHNLLRQFSKIK
jgi:hypothetical protein